MRLVVGLGNPGREYKNTRHNIGYMVLDNYLGKVEWKQKMESSYYILEHNGEQIIFIKPLTYMNLSGIAVQKFVNYYKISIKDILVIQDDLDLEVGNYKIKKNSSAGGHNGIKSIISSLNTDEFARLKIGIGKNEKIPTDKYVLSKFSNSELETLSTVIDKSKNIINLFLDNDIDIVQQKYKE